MWASSMLLTAEYLNSYVGKKSLITFFSLLNLQ